MKAVYQNDTTVEVKPGESLLPPIKVDVTENPPPPPPQQHQDKRRLGDVSGAAVYRNPEVSVASKRRIKVQFLYHINSGGSHKTD